METSNDVWGAQALVVVLGDLMRSPRMRNHSLSLLQHDEISSVTLLGYDESASLSTAELRLIPGFASESTQQKPFHVVAMPTCNWQALRRISAAAHILYKGIAVCLYLVKNLLCFLLTPSSSHKNKFRSVIQKVVVIQNPPAVPVLVVLLLLRPLTCLICWIRYLLTGVPRVSVHIVLDWHNLGFSIAEDTLAAQIRSSQNNLEKNVKEVDCSRHPVVRLNRFLEHHLCTHADSHLTVTSAMRDFLCSSFGVSRNSTYVFYDRPTQLRRTGHKLNMNDRHALLCRLNYTPERLFAVPTVLSTVSSPTGSTVTIQTVGPSLMRLSAGSNTMSVPHAISSTRAEVSETACDRVAVMISSTSWTPDEDFDVLLDVLLRLESRLHQRDCEDSPIGGFNRLLCIITGKGDLRDSFQVKIDNLVAQGKLGQRVAIRLEWLSIVDYHSLLSVADVGVSLHKSTSGLDLPMKVLDMFGSELPVIAWRFPTLGELIREFENGVSFGNVDELDEKVMDLLFPKHPEFTSADRDGHLFILEPLRRMSIRAGELSTWSEHWDEVVGHLVNRVTSYEK